MDNHFYMKVEYRCDDEEKRVRGQEGFSDVGDWRER